MSDENPRFRVGVVSRSETFCALFASPQGPAKPLLTIKSLTSSPLMPLVVATKLMALSVGIKRESDTYRVRIVAAQLEAIRASTLNDITLKTAVSVDTTFLLPYRMGGPGLRSIHKRAPMEFRTAGSSQVSNNR